MTDDLIDKLRSVLEIPEAVAEIEAILRHYKIKASVAEFFEQHKVQIALHDTVQKANAELIALKEKHDRATD